MRKWQKWVTVAWLLGVAAFWIWVAYEDVELSAEQIAAFFSRFQHYIIVAYLVFGIIRAFTLIPNMTVVFVGSLLIHNFWILLATSVAGLIGSSAIIYFFGEELQLKDTLYRKFPRQLDKIQRGLDKYGSAIIFFWGFLPVVPSDLLSFFLGSIKFPFWKFILYYTIGHVITYSIIILSGKEFWHLFF